MTREWEFDTDSEDVDLERLDTELTELPAMIAISYLQDLKINAPIVYRRYAQWTFEKGKTVFNLVPAE